MTRPEEVAIRILSIWYGSWEKYRSAKRWPEARRAAIKWKTRGLLEHDRHLIPSQQPWRRPHG